MRDTTDPAESQLQKLPGAQRHAQAGNRQAPQVVQVQSPLCTLFPLFRLKTLPDSDTIATQKATASKTELRLLVKEKRLLTLLQA